MICCVSWKGKKAGIPPSPHGYGGQVGIWYLGIRRPCFAQASPFVNHRRLSYGDQEAMEGKQVLGKTAVIERMLRPAE